MKPIILQQFLEDYENEMVETYITPREQIYHTKAVNALKLAIGLFELIDNEISLESSMSDADFCNEAERFISEFNSTYYKPRGDKKVIL